ncbi:GRIP and coiled-coil domain-containing 2 [Pelobates cultripes]|uniref:GRIP and coiled-coil domain-containing 2 n=1 Tax=Pelobates cultripes TaxID=61616 RepID=A0AAD1VKU2_PELCU|nr:GRIP and coiled-coil domain-containing 2 [Pelobates cultripes]
MAWNVKGAGPQAGDAKQVTEAEVECVHSAPCPEMEDTGQDGILSPATPGAGKSKLDLLPKEELIKFAKKQMVVIQKVKGRCSDLEKEVEVLKSRPVKEENNDVLQALSERLDSVLLEKAEIQQQLVILKKENAKTKHEPEDAETKRSELQKSWEGSHNSLLKEVETLKYELQQTRCRQKDEVDSMQRELQDAIERQNALSDSLQLCEDKKAESKKLEEEVQQLHRAYKEQISDLNKALQSVTEEKNQEIAKLKDAALSCSEEYCAKTQNLNEELLKLGSVHQTEVSELMNKLEYVAKQYESEKEKTQDLIKQYENKERLLIEETEKKAKYECEIQILREKLENHSSTFDSTPVEQGKAEHLEGLLAELESRHSILRDELTYTNNVKAELEMEVQQLKAEYFHEREDLEFKINELQLAIEDYNNLTEKLQSQLQTTKTEFERLRTEQSKGIQDMREQHKKEIAELKQAISARFENERSTLTDEINVLKEQCVKLEEEKEEALSNYDSIKQTLLNFEMELGESAGKISKEFKAMKEQQATDVHELQQKLRSAYKDKNDLMETVNRLKAEAENLSSKKTEYDELQLQISHLQKMNEEIMASLSQKEEILKDTEVKFNQNTVQNTEMASSISSLSERLSELQTMCKSEEAKNLALQQEAESQAKCNAELKETIDELTKQLEESMSSSHQNQGCVNSLQQQMDMLVLEKQKMEIELQNGNNNVSRLGEENNMLVRELDKLKTEHDDCLTLRNELEEMRIKLQDIAEGKECTEKLLETEKHQIEAIQCQLIVVMEALSLENNEEQDLILELQTISAAVCHLNQENQHLTSQIDEKSVQLGRLQEELESQCAELRALSSDYSKEKMLLKEELEETLADKEALQMDLLEMKIALEKAKLENQDLLSHTEKLAADLECIEKPKTSTNIESNQEDVENKDSSIHALTQELDSAKDLLSKAKALELEQQTYMSELQNKIDIMLKESKEKEEKSNKIKAVAIKAKKELDSSKKEVQSTREELERLKAEKDQLSVSMKDLMQTAEGYQNLLLEYDRQTEQLETERERNNNAERQMEDLCRQLRAASVEQEKLTSINEDYVARMETMQSNNKLLEAQLLETQRAKTVLDKELEAERLMKEQKMKEFTGAQKQVEELQTQLQKERKQLQKTMQELELVRKDAQQSTLMDMEIAHYDRLVKELNQTITNKSSQLDDLEQEVRIQKQKQEMLQEEISSLQATLEQHEERSTKMKQLLVKTKKELADTKQSESDQLILQASLRGELEASQQQLESYKIQLAELMSERHKVQEQFRTLTEQHQRAAITYQQKLSALQDECAVAKTEQATVSAEFESYKVRVHNVLKQQKNKSISQTEQEVFKQEREHLQIMLDQVKAKLQETQQNLQINTSELLALQSEHDTLLERHNKMLQETVTKEAELREKLCTAQSENVILKTEHAQAISQLSAQIEAQRNSFQDKIRHMQDDHRKTVETLQQQLTKVESQLFQIKSESSVSSSQQSLKNLRERRQTDLPLLDMYSVAREEGEGMETTDTESVSSASTHVASLEQLLNSSDLRPDKLTEPTLWQPEVSKEELTQKLTTTSKSVDHLSGLLHETEATNAILMEQITLLKNEIRRLERNQEREKSVANLEYLKNVLLQFIFLKAGSERQRLLPVIDTMLQLSPEEKAKLVSIAQGMVKRVMH